MKSGERYPNCDGLYPWLCEERAAAEGYHWWVKPPLHEWAAWRDALRTMDDMLGDETSKLQIHYRYAHNDTLRWAWREAGYGPTTEAVVLQCISRDEVEWLKRETIRISGEMERRLPDYDN